MRRESEGSEHDCIDLEIQRDPDNIRNMASPSILSINLWQYQFVLIKIYIFFTVNVVETEDIPGLGQYDDFQT